MTSKFQQGREILSEKGSRELGKRAIASLLRDIPGGDRILYEVSRRAIESRQREESDLEDILDTVLNIQPGYRPYKIRTLQLREEIRQLAQFVASKEPDTVLEIGTADGGSFYTWARYFDTATHLISLDLPGGEFGGGYNKRKTDIYRRFAPHKRMEFVRDNSHDLTVKNRVAELIPNSKAIDFLFIDGDHSYEGVKQDFEMYGDLVAEDGVIAFHDIVNHPDTQEEVENRGDINSIDQRHLIWSQGVKNTEVHEFWKEVREEYDTKEFISHSKQTWGGIGIVHK